MSHTLRIVLTSLLLPVVLAGLAACGGDGRVEGSLIVSPNSTSSLAIEGKAETTLELEQRGPKPVILVDGDAEEAFEAGTSKSMTFKGRRQLTFRNEGSEAVRIYYVATSAGGVSSSLEQR